MSVFRKFLDKFKIDKVNDGKPYSFEELMNMSDAELGALYRNNGEEKWGEIAVSEKSKSAIQNTIKFSSPVSLIIIGITSYVGMVFGGNCLINKLFTNVLTNTSLIIAKGMNIILFSPIFMILVLQLSAFLIHKVIKLYTRKAAIKAGANAFKNVKKHDVKIIDSLELLNNTTYDTAHIYDFLKNAEEAVKTLKEYNSYLSYSNYPDEEIGKLVKIVLPVMKLDHDGGLMNDKSFKVLDDNLNLSERIQVFNKEIQTDLDSAKKDKVRKKEENAIRNEHEKREKEKQAIENSISIASSLVNGLSNNDDMDKILEEHPEFRKIKDLNKKLDEQKIRLDTSLNTQCE